MQNSEEVSLRAKYDELPLVRPAVRHGFSGLRVFTDGSAHVPKEVRFRKAGFAVEASEANIAHRTAGGVPGRQTVPRAELLAGLQGSSLGNNAYLSTDCLTLVRQRGKPRSVPYGLMPNGDIWDWCSSTCVRTELSARLRLARTLLIYRATRKPMSVPKKPQH